ncbi:MAG: glycoside hydrolase family 2 TIM barrel-domain containing protein [Prevotella sp.]|nr:glycoside hydrolase family 2 TIM barrel-domain containing protein [Prevotella sp.]
MMHRLMISLLCAVCSMASGAQKTIDLSGKWHVRLTDKGGKEVQAEASLPGSLQTNGLGDDPALDTKWTGSLYDSSFYFNPHMASYRRKGHFKFPFFLTPNKHFIGHAVWSRSFDVPKTWKRRRVILHLERPHIETTVFINGVKVGHQLSLSVPHQYDVTDFLRFGRTNSIDIDIYNGIENVCVGQDSHSVTDQTQGNWNGIAGRIELQSAALKKHGAEAKALYPYTVRVFPDLKTGYVTVTVNQDTFRLHIERPQPWSELQPTCYTRTIDYHGLPIPVTFGFRDIEIRGRQFVLNGRPIWIRGTVECCDFPLTGYPPTDVAPWIRIFRKCRQYGLNAMRFHSYCPPDAAFTAADSVGFYLMPEGPSWPNHGVKLRSGQPIDAYLTEETRRIVDTYGNHPSFLMMAAGNEPAGNWVSWCNDWVEAMKTYDPRRVYCGASVGGGWEWDDKSQFHVKGGARGLDWNSHAPHSDDDYEDQILFPRNYRSNTPNNTPIIAHEQGQWCAFPDLDERRLYTGVFRAGNFDIFADLLQANGMGSMGSRFLQASSKLQTLAYKYEIERNLRTRDYAGFQLLGLNDYSGQGTALVGRLNVFWQEKGVMGPLDEAAQEQAAREWRMFCGPVVPLARFPRFIYSHQDTLQVDVEVYNAWQDMADRRISWTVRNADTTVADGTLCHHHAIPLGKNHAAGRIVLPLSGFRAPMKLTLQVDISGETDMASAPMASNSWDFWVYPVLQPETGQRGIHITDTLDAKAQDVLRKGGKVLLCAAGKVRYGDDVRQYYLPVFWNTSWFKMRPPHTTGAYIDTKHPLFKGFPTDDWSNLNWWELLNRAPVMNLSHFPKDYQPFIQPIDTWHVSRKLGMAFEANVLGGRLLMTTMDITHDLSHRLVAAQMHKAILDYMAGPDFRPTLSLDAGQIRMLFEQHAPAVNMFTNDSPDELKPKLK